MAKKKERGWIRLYRQITESDLWKAKEPFDERSAWIDLLLLANHEPRMLQTKTKQIITIEAGQLLTSTVYLSKRWRWSRNRVNRFFERLTEQGMCTTNGAPYGTTITIVKWGFFQGGRTANGTTDGTSDGATDGATDGARTIINIQELINNKHVKQEGAGAPDGSLSGGYDVE